MLILVEKPSVAKDFAAALNCFKHNGFYSNPDKSIVIINCIGHLYNLFSPQDYDSQFSDWKKLPVIPNKYLYKVNESVRIQANLVNRIIKDHLQDKIIIATDADREGEIIARECLDQAAVQNYSNIYRFWVSQALTEEVIKDGLNKVLPITHYDKLAKQGFYRQYADWLIGMNFTRFITNSANQLLPVGRVQTAILYAIYSRCIAIDKFISSKYYEIYGIFKQPSSKDSVSGIYVNVNKTSFSNDDIKNELIKIKGKNATLLSSKKNEKHIPAPQLYNLNALQKEAYRSYGYRAEQTLNIVQSLYEELKCVSYPRTPSRVMGECNVALCKNIYIELLKAYPKYSITKEHVNISLSNKRCFNDKKLEAHHALIPLKSIGRGASSEQLNIYNIILERFMMAFLDDEIYTQLEYILSIDNYSFKVTGKKIINNGWKDKKYNWKNVVIPDNLELQDITSFDFNNLYLTDIKSVEKWTKPPKYFNEASILSFMENPKNITNDNQEKLIGLGTPATRHTFIPKLIKSGYVVFDKKNNIVCTKLGKAFIESILKSSLNEIANIDQTTLWETKLNDSPENFYKELVNYVVNSVKSDCIIDNKIFNENVIRCPICNNLIKKGKSNWYCSDYTNGCKFPSIWFTIAGAKITESDVRKLVEGKTTSLKHCLSKNKKKFDCRFKLDTTYKVTFVFD